MCNGYYIMSNLNNVLKRGYYESPLGYYVISWFVDGVIEEEIKMTFYFKNTSKDFLMTEKDEELYKNINTCRLCGKRNFVC